MQCIEPNWPQINTQPSFRAFMISKICIVSQEPRAKQKSTRERTRHFSVFFLVETTMFTDKILIMVQVLTVIAARN